MLRMMTLLAIVLSLAGGFPPAGAASTAKQPATTQPHRVHVIVIDKMATARCRPACAPATSSNGPITTSSNTAPRRAMATSTST